MAINLLNIKDENLVKKTNKTISLAIGGQVREYPVYQVSLELLYNNDYSYRMAPEAVGFGIYETFRERINEEQRNTYDEAMTMRFEGKLKANVLYRYFMDLKDACLDTTSYLEQIEKNYMGIVLSDGRILDGNLTFVELKDIAKRQMREKEEGPNRYLKVMEYMRKHNSKPLGFNSAKKGEEIKEKPVYFNTIILELDRKKDKMLLKELEIDLVFNRLNNIYCQSCKSHQCYNCIVDSSYNMLDVSIGIYRDVVLEKNLTLEEYERFKNKDVAYKKYNLQRCIDIAQLITEFLAFIKRPKKYIELYEITGLNRHMIAIEFDKLVEVLKPMDEDKREIWKKILFTYFLLYTAINEPSIIANKYMPLIKTGNYKLYEEELLELCNRFEERFKKEKYDMDPSRLKDFAYDSHDILYAMDCVIYRAQEYSEEKNEEYIKALKEDEDIGVLELPVRIHNCLKRAGIKTACQLVEMTEEDIINLKNLGDKFKEELRMIVKRLRMIKEDL